MTRNGSNDMDSARRRVALKLCALAYVATRHGTDACPEFTADAVRHMCSAALQYVSALTKREIAPPRGDDLFARRTGEAIRQLELAALAYDRARHGSDAHTEFTRAALAMLCQAAVGLAESVTGEPVTVDTKSLGG